MTEQRRSLLKKFCLAVLIVGGMLLFVRVITLSGGAQFPAGNRVTSCSLAEGQTTGWPFAAFTPGCNPDQSNNLAVVADIFIDGAGIMLLLWLAIDQLLGYIALTALVTVWLVKLARRLGLNGDRHRDQD